MKTSLLIAAFVFCAGLSPAATIQFDLIGNGGPGLLSTNQNGVINGTPGMGGEIGAGLLYDDVSGILIVNVGWGTGNGFATNLTGVATAGHIHGVTPAAAPTSFNQDVGVLINLDTAPLTWNTSASNGSTVGSVTIPEANRAALLEGRMYINIHTVANPSGEIRGNLMPIPEPAIGLLAALGAAVLGARRRRA